MGEPEKQETLVEIVVPPGYREGERLDVYLTRFLVNASRAKVQRGVKQGRVSVSGTVEHRPSRAVQAGDVIACTILRPPPMQVAPEAIPLDIVFEDEWLIVVNKPAGMVVHPAYGNRTRTLVNALLHHVGAGALTMLEEEPGEDDLDEAPGDPPVEAAGDESGDRAEEPPVEAAGDASGARAEEPPGDAAGNESGDRVVEPPGGAGTIVGLSGINAVPRFAGDPAIRPGIVHRLDKDTSGLMVIAKDDVTHRRLARQFAERTIRRHYEALVWGHPEPPAGRIEASLGRDPRDRKKVAVVRAERGKTAATRYETIERFDHTALVAFRLETGRTHQIRVHAKHIGNPVVGDATYGGTRIARGPDTARRRAYWRNLFEILPRQALHARTLGFRHPGSGREMDFGSELPSDMAAAIERLRRGDPG